MGFFHAIDPIAPHPATKWPLGVQDVLLEQTIASNLLEKAFHWGSSTVLPEVSQKPPKF